MSSRISKSRSFLAVLSCLALIAALLAVGFASPLGKVSASGYEPERTISVTSQAPQVNGKIAIVGGEPLTEGETYTVKGYYKLDNYAPLDGQDAQGPNVTLPFNVKLTADTDGWVAFEMEYTANQYKYFEFWYSTGTLSLGDVTIIDADEEVVYDMRTDAALTATDSIGFPNTLGIWYFGYYGSPDGVSGTIDPVVEKDYEPERVMSLTPPGNDAQGRMSLTGDESLTEGTTYTVAGYYKVENFTAVDAGQAKVNIGSSLSVTGNTDGWVPFSFAYTQNAGAYTSFEFWYATGTLSLADVTLTDGDGNVAYDMRTDELLEDREAGAFPWDISVWYFAAYTSFDNISLAVGPVVSGSTTDPSQPGGSTDPSTDPTDPTVPQEPIDVKAVKLVVDGSAAFPCVNGKIRFMDPTELLTMGETYTIKGYMKMEDYGEIPGSNGNWSVIHSGRTGNTGGWEAFERTYEMNEDNLPWFSFQLWYASGTLTVGGVQILAEDGTVVYDMNTDAELTPETLAGGQGPDGGDGLSAGAYNRSIWWFGYSGSYTEGLSYEILETTIQPSEIVIPEKPGDPDDPGTDDPGKPSTPSATDGYNRTISIVSTSNENPTMRLGLMYDNFEDGPYYLLGKVKVDGLTAQAGGETPESYVEFQYSEGMIRKMVSFTEDTGGWMDLTDADGNLLSFDSLSKETGDLTIHFGNLFAKGTFSVADLRIVTADGEIVYSMANDPYLYGKGDMRSVKPGVCMWSASDYGAAETHDTSFPIRTKGDDEYIPNRVITIEVPEGSGTVNPVLGIMQNNSLFTPGETYTVTGRIKVELGTEIEAAGESANASVAGGNYGTTGGWVNLQKDDGSPVTFIGLAEDTERLTFLLWYTNGTFSIADLRILDSEGNVVYDMATDPILDEDTELAYGTPVSIYYPASFGATEEVHFYVTVNPDPVVHTDADYQNPVFVESGKLPETGGTNNPGDSNVPGDVTTGETTLLVTVAGLAALASIAVLFALRSRKERE